MPAFDSVEAGPGVCGFWFSGAAGVRVRVWVFRRTLPRECYSNILRSPPWTVDYPQLVTGACEFSGGALGFAIAMGDHLS